MPLTIFAALSLCILNCLLNSSYVYVYVYVFASQADFLNQGSLQMAGNVSVDEIASSFDGSSLYAGTIAPMDAGGDPFAMDYHSWDSDFGHLSYTEYLRLRTEFVSRAPTAYVAQGPQN